MAAISVPQALKNQLDTEAKARGVKVGWFANKLLEEALEALVPAEEMRLTRPRPGGG